MVYTHGHGIQKAKRSKLTMVLIALGVAVAVAAFATIQSVTAAPVPVTVYDNIASPVPGNVPSLGYEATSTSELGGQVGLAGTERNNPKVTVLMSSWGCESGAWITNDCATTPGAIFSHPITLKIYAVGAGNTPGALIETKTQTFNIPFRPTVDTVNCSDGKWFDGNTCFNGLATPVTFDFSNLNLPNNVIISVAYNTSNHGYSPLGVQPCNTAPGGCGYDSLNVGIETTLSVGSQPFPDDAYYGSSYGRNYCDLGVGGVGTFRLDAGCWTGYQPSFEIQASAPSVGPATNKDQCKNGVWQTFNNPTYKNQGDCVSAVASKGKAKGNPLTY